MRQITQEVCQAFERGVEFKKGNDEVIVWSLNNDVIIRMSYRGNLIAEKDEFGVKITDAGWNTKTTKERLNGLSGVHIVQKKGVWYLNGSAWDGSWIRIK